jgi:vacuolar-type H+-ATPase subunit H
MANKSPTKNNPVRFSRSNKPTQTVPRAALRFAADVEVGSNSEESKSAPVTIQARSKDPVDHWYWGRMVHDLSGFSAHKPKLPLDYCHNDSEVLGYVDTFDVASGALVASGMLTPFDEKDRASEVLFKQAEGVPYEASIYFDQDNIVLEYVPDGMAAEVNGYQFEGPGVIARQWSLRGLAICPHGYDKNTVVEFKDGDSAGVAVKFMSDETQETVDAAVEEATEAIETIVTEAVEAAAEAVEAEVEETEDDSEETTSTEPVEASTALSRAAEGKRFLTAFGDKGGKWFAEGKTFAEAQALFTKSLQDENKALREKNAELASKLAARRGEKDPVSFSAEASEPSNPKHNVLGPNLSKVASQVKFAGKK